MVNSAPRPAATSNYRQVRLTCTQEATGRVSYSVYAKGLNDAWQESQCLTRASVMGPHRLESTEDVIQLLLNVLHDQQLPF